MDEKENIKKTNSSDESKETLEERFRRERFEWKDKVDSMSNKMKNVLDLISLEVEVFSNRQIALEYSHLLMHMLSKLNAKIRVAKKQKLLHYTQNYDLKLDKSQKEMFISIDLEKMILKQELMNNHLSYIKETIETIDKMIYGIKWRLTLEQFRRDNIK